MKIINNLIDHCDFRTITKGGLFINTDGEVCVKIELVYIVNADSKPGKRFNAIEIGGGCRLWISDDEPVIEIKEVILK